jgi:NADPH2:quinone reductase
MLAWRVHDFGEPSDVFVLDEIDPPTAADLDGLGMDLSGWVPLAPGAAPFTDWVLMDVSVAALALPDVTMARGTYPVPVRRPYVSGQEAVGVVTAAGPGRVHLVGRRVVAETIVPGGGLAPVYVGVAAFGTEQLSDEELPASSSPHHRGPAVILRRRPARRSRCSAPRAATNAVQCAPPPADVIAIVGSRTAAFCPGGRPRRGRPLASRGW